MSATPWPWETGGDPQDTVFMARGVAISAPKSTPQTFMDFIIGSKECSANSQLLSQLEMHSWRDRQTCIALLHHSRKCRSCTHTHQPLMKRSCSTQSTNQAAFFNCVACSTLPFRERICKVKQDRPCICLVPGSPP